ncbi:MAG: hypothetical protein LBE60_18815 [Microbacterium sp.]|jgi:hypothetical protein|uniref:hypothetical protein n=1 Tax=Microbacterium sp. TaxID=51671 RepID=UPI00281F2E47|nr:hypothetical protein [Microbacterium sp.]MDR2323686.1 hypothetical protein [Microbacterium sp.]
MGMFTQKPEEKATWAALPGEPLDRDEATDLPEAPVADPLGLGLGAPTSATTVAIPMPAEAEAEAEAKAEPES